MLMTKDDMHILDFDSMEMKAVKKNRQTIRYYNVPCAYDIETSSFRDIHDNKVAITYSHALNIDGDSFLFRTWEDFIAACDFISEIGGLDFQHRVIIYIHNLSYEFQFIKKHFKWAKNGILFNGGDRKVLSALTSTGIEFRCSMMLSAASLAVTAKNLVHYKIDKMKGDLDYDLIRTPLTPLNPRELGYILNDVLIVEYFIREAMMESGDITKLPLTNTGYVRNYCRDTTIIGKGKEAKMYRALMEELTIEPEEYLALSSAFAGGYTHANIMRVNKTIENVTAYDIVSSYPGRKLAYQYPMSKGEQYDCLDKDDFFLQLDTHCCLFYVILHGVNRVANEAYISYSKLTESKNFQLNNGRVEAAERIELWTTEVDFNLIMQSYSVDDFEVGTMYRYRRGYLPTTLIKAVLKFFNEKTTFKDLEDKVTEYLKSKGMLNSTYGMIVMDIIRTQYKWDDDHHEAYEEKDQLEESIAKNNASKKRFLFYPWGVWITAYARYEVFSIIVKLGDDYVYADTDSVYFTNGDKYKQLFIDENDRIVQLLHAACDHHGLDYDVLSPMDKKGKKHTIGIWDFDGFYTRFKTLGAKRYMVEKLVNSEKQKRQAKKTGRKYDKKKKQINITVSGVNKSHAMPYLLKTYGGGIFDAFNEDLYVPEGACGKMTHSYSPAGVEARGVIRDYNGVPYAYHEKSWIHLEKTHYSMSISNEFKNFFEYLQNNAQE